MPVCTDLPTLKQIIRPGVAVRSDGESCIDITRDAIRLRAVSEDKTCSVDYKISTLCPTLSVENAHSTFWIPGDRVAGILRAGPDSPITLTTPPETAD